MTDRLSRIGFAYNPAKAEAVGVLERGHAWCRANGVEAWDAHAIDAERISAEMERTDLVCVLGGDATFLRTARSLEIGRASCRERV